MATLQELKATDGYRSLTREQAMESLQTTQDGLSNEEADVRLQRFGRNEIEEEPHNALLEFLRRYWGPMPWLLEFAMVLTLIVGHRTEGALIFILLTVNAVIGSVQSQNSRKAVELLRGQLQVQVRVLRDGRWTLLDAHVVVPGDVVALKLGDLVPADAYIIDGEVSVDTSSLTGESLPQDVQAGGLLFSSAIIRRGDCHCLVVNTGAATSFGKTVSLVQIAKPRSRQQEIMFGIVQYMMYLGVAASVTVAAYAVAIHDDLFSILSLVIIFLMGAIPVALPAVMTIVQAVGATTLSKKGVLVTRLDSIEDASSIDTFCFDKTGTITQNLLTVTDCVALGDCGGADVARFAALASNADEMDAIDAAVLRYADEEHAGRAGYTQCSYLPFNPANKRTEALVEKEGVTWRIIKGSPQIIAELCDAASDGERAAIERAVDGCSKKGWRTIGVAVRREGGASSEVDQSAELSQIASSGEAAPAGGYTFVGLLALSDPPRDDSAEMIRRIHELGIKTIMLTGDNVAIARQIAREVGIGGNIRRAGELEGLSEDERLRMVQACDGFAEVYPKDKYEIVKLLQDDGHMVGMTGDGVNDAPALKQAELGCAVSGATDVARASASVVLTCPGLGEIIDTITTSRQTYQRMLTWVINKVTKVVEVVALFTVGYFWRHSMLISLLGMSLLVFANDFATMSIATDNVVSTGSPNSWNIRSIVSAAAVLGILFALEDLFVAWLGIGPLHLSFDQLCTLVMLSLVFNTQFRILTVRERRHFWASLPGRQLLLVSVVTIIGFAALGTSGSLVPTLEVWQVAVLLGIGITSAFVIDFIKTAIFGKLGV